MPFEHMTTPMPPNARDQARNRIGNLDTYEAATERVRKLADYPEGTPESEELAALIQAIMEWDRKNDAPTGWH